MTPDLPYALGCPSCPHHVVVSVEDPDSSITELHSHALRTHAGGYDRAEANRLVNVAAELTEAEVAAR